MFVVFFFILKKNIKKEKMVRKEVGGGGGGGRGVDAEKRELAGVASSNSLTPSREMSRIDGSYEHNGHHPEQLIWCHIFLFLKRKKLLAETWQTLESIFYKCRSKGR